MEGENFIVKTEKEEKSLEYHIAKLILYMIY